MNGKELNSQKHCLVHFVFKHCASIMLENFNQQNELSTIRFSVEKQVLPPGRKSVPVDAVTYIKDHQQFTADEVLSVEFISEFGLSGAFKCYVGEVLAVTACDEDGIPIFPE